jgi:ABC-type uncharacterized transport system permease subunit
MIIDINFIGLIITSIMASAVPLILASCGELITERSGVLNLGVEGMMIIGAISGFALMTVTGSLFIAVIGAMLAGVLSWFIFYKTYLGFQMKVSGFSLKTAKYAGYKGKKMIILVFLISGACAGLAGVGEITGPIGQLHREVSPDYGFTAIIVAFLGRLHPVGIISAPK